MNEQLLSVIVPVYNSERYLTHCVESLLDQTYQVMEILLIDDGSADGSRKICDGYAEKYNNIFIFHQKNAGANAARKKGIEHAKGSYIAFVDSDDWVVPNFFEVLMLAAEKENADMVTTNVTVDTESGSMISRSAVVNGSYTQEEIEKYIFPCMVYDDIERKPGIFAYLCAKVLKREPLLDSITDLDTHLAYGEDGAIVFPFLAGISKLVVTDYPGYHYVQHDASVTHRLDPDMFRNVSYLEKYLKTKFQKMGKYALVETQIHYFIRDLLFRIIEADYEVNCGRILCVPPYEIIPRSSKLVIYGAGKAGKEFVRLFLQSHYAEVTAWVDQNFGRELYSYQIENPESIKEKEYDYVLIALTDEKKAYEVKEYLHSIGIEDKKILWKEINWG